MATGSAHFDRISAALGEPGLPPRVRAVAVLGVLLAVAGIAFKLSAVPFHLWTPDTYAGAPLPVAAFLSSVSKAAGAAAIVVLLTVGVLPAGRRLGAGRRRPVGRDDHRRQPRRPAPADRRPAARLVDGRAGGLGAPAARRRRRGGAREARDAAAGAVGYLAAYVAATLAVFAVVVVLARHHPAGEEHAVDAYRGLARREPVAAAVLAFGLACLAGLPPGIVGLVAKVVAVRPVVDAGAWPLALVAAANVALGLAYYLRWAALLFAPAEAAARPDAGGCGRPRGWRWAAPAAACVALSVWPQIVAGRRARAAAVSVDGS